MKLPLPLLIAAVLPFPATHAEDQAGAELTKKPVSATIIGETGEWPGVGNVQVTYDDGTKDLWTTKKNTSQPHVAPDGTVGWVLVADEASEINASYKLRRDRMIVLCKQGKIRARLKCDLPFIRSWDFAKGGEQVVIESARSHGSGNPAAGGHRHRQETLGEVTDDGSQPLPEWAKLLAAP